MTYSKPDFYVTEFAADRAFAAGCTSQNDSYYGYEAQTVYCIVAGSHTIFEEGTSGCENIVDLSGGTSTWYFATSSYNGVSYFVWHDGNVDAMPTAEQETILASVGITTSGWHAATYNSTLYELLSASY